MTTYQVLVEGETVEAAAIVSPLVSSMTWA